MPRPLQRCVPLLLAALLPTARAGTLDLWSYDDYEEDSSLVGVDGWEAGFSLDLWYGFRSSTSGNSYVESSTDYNEGDYAGDWGEGGARDNFLVNAEGSFADGLLRTTFYTQDDDTIGVICRFVDARNLTLLLMTGDAGSSAIDADGPYTAIVRVTDGVAELLAISDDTYTSDTLQSVELRCDDGLISASVWSASTDTWEDPDLLLEAVDSGDAELGAVGFYSYDSGGPSSSETRALFGAIETAQNDEDDDGVADDADNCEGDANADQSDLDADGRGDVCDPTPGEPIDTGGETGGPDETGRPGDTGEPPESGEPGDPPETGESGSASETGEPDSEPGDSPGDSAPKAEDSFDTSIDEDSGLDGPALDELGLRGGWGCASLPVRPQPAATLGLLALTLIGARRRPARP